MTKKKIHNTEHKRVLQIYKFKINAQIEKIQGRKLLESKDQTSRVDPTRLNQNFKLMNKFTNHE
jgi:hypothetical protein